MWGQNTAFGVTIEELQKDVEIKKEEIRKLEEEAAKYRVEIAEKQKAGKTLKGEIDRINAEIKRVRNDITLTERRIEKAGLEIETLHIEIQEKEESMQTLKIGLRALLQAFAEKDDKSLVVLLVKYDAFSGLFQHIDFMRRTQERIESSLTALRLLREDLVVKKTGVEEKKEELEDLGGALEGKKEIKEGIQKNKNELLLVTKSEEKKYQTLLLDREKKRRTLEDEVLAIEEKIKVIIDPSTLPAKRSGVLGLPLPNISLASCYSGTVGDKNCVTQFFGHTSFAQAGGYGGNGHNGMDFRADIGTPLLAAEEVVVEEVGDTDTGCRGVSYGKWILIRHPNNLSTLYAHLSAIGVSSGQTVKRGERTGYTGKSGYATGPHLHFTVFVTKAVEIKTIISKVCGTPMILPIAGSDPVSGIEGYLNPMDYL